MCVCVCVCVCNVCVCLPSSGLRVQRRSSSGLSVQSVCNVCVCVRPLLVSACIIWKRPLHTSNLRMEKDMNKYHILQTTLVKYTGKPQSPLFTSVCLCLCVCVCLCLCLCVCVFVSVC